MAKKYDVTVLGTKDISVMAVFRGKVVGLQTSGRKYAIMPVKHGQRLIITYLGHQDVKVGVTEVTGWNNNPNETLAVTITLNGFNDGGSLVVLKKYMGMMRDLHRARHMCSPTWRIQLDQLLPSARCTCILPMAGTGQKHIISA